MSALWVLQVSMVPGVPRDPSAERDRKDCLAEWVSLDP